jgi:hypothetical protein
MMQTYTDSWRDNVQYPLLPNAEAARTGIAKNAFKSGMSALPRKPNPRKTY